MKEYSAYGFNEFVICAGYKQHYIKEWFKNYFIYTSDVTFDFTDGDKSFFMNSTLSRGKLQWWTQACTP